MNNGEEFEEATNLQEYTNTGKFIYEVQGDEYEKKSIKKDITINEHVILNQCGCLLTIKRHLIKGNKKENYFIQKLYATSIGTSVPLMYLEGLLFPNIFYLALLDSLSIVGAMPAPLLIDKNDFSFASLMEHT